MLNRLIKRLLWSWEVVDEAPMIPVGRKNKVPPLPEGGSFQCVVSGCSYQTESSRELAFHSRECGQPWYVCQTRGCGHRELGITGIKEHMEVVHRSVKIEDWDHKVREYKVFCRGLY